MGSGYAILDLGRGKKVVQSVPLELSADNVMLLKEGEIKGYINSAETFKKLGWSIERYERALVCPDNLNLSCLKSFYVIENFDRGWSRVDR